MNRRHRPGLGIALILLMALCFGTMDTSVKYVGAFVPVLLVLTLRYATQALVMSVWLLRRGGRQAFRTQHPKFQLVRGALLLFTSGTSFFGVQYLPVAEFTAIGMLTPVVVTLLAGWLLRERVTRLRWLLVCGGFAGALIVIRPGSGLFGWAVLLPLTGAFSYASFQVLTSKLAGMEDPYTTHFYTGLIGTALLLPLLWASPVEPLAVLAAAAPQHLALLAGIGLLGTAGHLFLILALGFAPTATLMPFIYAQIAVAAAASWALLGHVPDGWAWVGMAVVAACGGASAALNWRPPPAARPVPAAPGHGAARPAAE
ncbi:DMT family transporter [Caldimonas tepidiphila]|uniref:DMT family transporter n=1 Tax=Caldimonas tepidiphila TaxID=2315841 RepID=UPI001F0BB938|nr:DMT family transporter [Caldimonas tepidiphila]